MVKIEINFPDIRLVKQYAKNTVTNTGERVVKSALWVRRQFRVLSISPFWAAVFFFVMLYFYHKENDRISPPSRRQDPYSAYNSEAGAGDAGAPPVPYGGGKAPVAPDARAPQADILAPGYPVNFSLRVDNSVIDNLEVNLPPLLKGYKNPCWIEPLPKGFSYRESYYSKCAMKRKTKKPGGGMSKTEKKFDAFAKYLQNRTKRGESWRVRCFPSFFVLGVGKCGTTDLFDIMRTYLVDVVPGFLKELHFWNWKRDYERNLCHGEEPSKPSFAHYLDTYDAAAEVIRRAVISRNNTEYHPLIIGDFSPSLFTFLPQWEQRAGNKDLSQPRFTSADYIRLFRPDAKFIVMVRDPVERVYSNYQMKSRNSMNDLHYTPDTFHKEVVMNLNILRKCLRDFTPRICVYKYKKFDLMTHMTNSMYEVFARDWFAVFPRDNFLFIRLEDYGADRAGYTSKVVKFLDLTPITPATEAEIDRKAVSGKAKKATMKDETRKLLQDFYRPWNIKLAELLEDDRFMWGY